MLAAERWRQMVEMEHAQSDELRGSVPPPVDHWRPYAAQFRADRRRLGDVFVDLLLEFIGPDDTVIDVGAGGRRLALPIALNCRSLVAVEPTESMTEVLTQQAQESGITNVNVVQNELQDAVVDPVDVVLCAHVLYTIRDIGGFLKSRDPTLAIPYWWWFTTLLPKARSTRFGRKSTDKNVWLCPACPNLGKCWKH